MKSKTAILGSLATLAFVLFLGTSHSADPKQPAKSKTWAAEGTLLDACQCDVFCACEFNGKPTAGHCDDTSLVEITKGHFGDVNLDGKHFVIVAQSPHGERMVDAVGRLNFAKIYVDQGTSQESAQALAGLARKMLGTFVDGADRIAKNETIEHAVIRTAAKDQTRSVAIPGVLDVQIELLSGGDKKTPIVIANHPFNEYGYADPQVARSTHYTFKDSSHDWNYSGRSASVRRFHMQGAL
jgi:hypothetical protein